MPNASSIACFDFGHFLVWSFGLLIGLEVSVWCLFGHAHTETDINATMILINIMYTLTLITYFNTNINILNIFIYITA